MLKVLERIESVALLVEVLELTQAPGLLHLATQSHATATKQTPMGVMKYAWLVKALICVLMNNIGLLNPALTVQYVVHEIFLLSHG